MDQNGSFPGGSAGARQASNSLSVYCAEPCRAESGAVAGSVPVDRTSAAFRDGFTGFLALQGADALNPDETGAVLSRLDQLIRWAQAQQARMLARMGVLFQEGLLQDTGILDRGTAFSLAAEEAATILSVPTGAAQMLLGEAEALCDTHTATLDALETGAISYGQAQIVVDQSQNIPAEQLPAFEAQMLGLAPGQTRNQFRVRAQRLRENTYPETIVKRQRTAYEQRAVWIQAEPDGMSKLCALLPAEKVQLFYNQLSTAARGEQASGDPRKVDQLRADILASLLEDGGTDYGGGGGCEGCRNGGNASGGLTGSGQIGGQSSPDQASRASRASRGKASIDSGAGRGSGVGTVPGCSGHGFRHGAGSRTEILVLITAETLFGADDQPAELHGYGPVSPETARRMAREAAKWTPVERDPDSAEILRVGRRRKVPAGMKRWLRARDGTCRFPGCRTNAVSSEIDHTTPWAQGGNTDHDNLEHLCRRHHMFKTRGFWKARQCSPGIIEWTSPGGRCYRTEPHLTLAMNGTGTSGTAPGGVAPSGTMDAIGQMRAGRGDLSAPGNTSTNDPNGYGDDPPPF